MDRNRHSAFDPKRASEIWGDRLIVFVDVPSFWKWTAKKFDRTSETVLAASGGGNADCGSEGFFLSVRAYVFIICGNGFSFLLEAPVWSACSLYGASDRSLQIIFLCPLSDGYTWRDAVWHGVCLCQYMDYRKNTEQEVGLLTLRNGGISWLLY